MTIARVGSGAAIAGVGGLTPAYPAGVANGRCALLKTTLKPDTGTITTPTGYLPFPGGAGTGGTGTTGLDTGPMRAALFYRILDGSETGTVSVAFTGNNNEFAVIDIYEATNGFNTAAFAATVASEATHGTGWQAVGAANLSLAAGDMLVSFSGCTSNASNNLTVSSRVIAAAGSTFAAISNAALSLTNSGNDSSLDWWDAVVTGGPSSGAPTYTSTHSANDSGVTVFAKLVEAAAGPTQVTGTATGLFGGTFTAAGNPVTVGAATGLFGGTFSAAGNPRTFGAVASSFGGTFTASGAPRVSGRTGGRSFGFQALAFGTPVDASRVRHVDFDSAGDLTLFPTEEYVSTADATTIATSVSGGEAVFASSTSGATTANDRRLFLFDPAFTPTHVDLLARFGRVVGVAPADTQRGLVARVKRADATLGQAPILWTNVIFGADGNGITGVWEWPAALNTLQTNQTGAATLYGPDATITGAGGVVTVTTSIPHLIGSDHIVQVVCSAMGLNVQVTGGITVVDDFSFSFVNATAGSGSGHFRWLFTPPGTRQYMRMRLNANVITAKYWMEGHPEPADGDTLRTTSTTLPATLASGAALKTDGGRVGIVIAHMGNGGTVLVDNFTAVDLAPTVTVSGSATGLFGGTFTAQGAPRTFGAAAGTFGGTFTAAGVPRTQGAASGAFGGTFTASGRPRTLGQATASFGGTFTASGSAAGTVTGAATGLFGGSFTASGQVRTVGVAAAAFGGTFTAAGRPRTVGIAAAGFGGTFSAAGVARTLGTASADFGGDFDASGIPVTVGAATADFGFTATASGSGVEPLPPDASDPTLAEFGNLQPLAYASELLSTTVFAAGALERAPEALNLAAAYAVSDLMVSISAGALEVVP